MFAAIRRFLAALWGAISLPFDLVGRSVYGLGRAVEPAFDACARVAGRAASAVGEALPYAGAGLADVLSAPFNAFRSVNVQAPAPEERGQGWQAAVEQATWGFTCFLYACRKANGDRLPDMSDVPPGVRAWLETLTPAEIVRLKGVMPDAIERHVMGDKDGAIRGVRPYVTPSRAKALEAARQKLAQVSLQKRPDEDLTEDLDLPVYAPRAA